ncbi:filamentous hemagglutinin N-terminal domain-containing protein [Providencia rettgeri]|uniref:two-partner secretion domain-containing protein n=1 Tax=Providencia sp. PROV158 TaxID=2949868 RepID=UPI00234AA3EA|nr:filamentous hemagglutinin N-terminal domain-containing protein [Providencia sp. PROV158]
MSQPIKSGSSNHTLKLKPIVLCVSAILGMTSMAHGEIINTNGAGVINQHNGPTIVNINKASDKGVSHNIYNKFDVDNKGVILNNSKDNVNTQLGGMINGNLNLAGGEAKVILNEVNSNNATTLNGMVEVAGKKAQVIVANPSGITCNSCGFINTESATLTTGKPIVTNGEILGYNVSKGQIIVNKNLTSNSPTELIARSAMINGQLKAKEIKVVTGNNFVDANGNVVSTVTPVGSRPSVSIDVSALGGMYADKITLVSTESGVGVRNKGIILAGDKGLTANVAGYLSNNANRIESSGDINLNSSTFHNDGLIRAKNNLDISTNETSSGYVTFGNDNGQLLSTAGDISLRTHNSILNRNGGVINAQNNVNIETIDIQNGGGLIKSNSADVNIDARGGIYQWRSSSSSQPEKRIIAGRDINITANRIINENAEINAGRDVILNTASSIENTNSVITAKRRISIDADSLTNKSSSITATNAKSDLNVTKYITNDANSVISSGRGLNITSAKLTNAGKIISPTNVPNTIPVPTYISNIKVDHIDNSGGAISGDQLNITSNTIKNELGFIDAKKLNITSKSLNNHGGYIRSYSDMILNVNQLNNSESSNFSRVASKFGLTNKVGGIEVLNGGITVTGDDVSNYLGFIKSAAEERVASLGGMEFNLTGRLSNNTGELTSGNDITITTRELSNYRGQLNSDGKLKIKSTESINNIYGKLNSKGVTELYAPNVSTYDNNETYSTDGTGIIYNPNGLNIIHIKKPTDNGISHNTYQSFNVSEKGTIFNNSSTMTTTKLGGTIAGNENLTLGNEAKVILNEIVGNNISLINGMMEVAGTAAQVIVANASGITCNSCGFINASRGAFVTGTPLVVGDNLVGYNVTKGQITVNKSLTSNNAVDFIARSVLINGDVQANELTISTGSNLFDSEGNVLSTTSGPYNLSNYGITIANNASLNADKMKLNVNESGYYLSNKGLINAGDGGLTVNAYAISNPGKIESKGNLDLTSTGRYTFNNDYGSIISTAGNVNITTNDYLHNRYNGLISANKNINLNINKDIQNGGGLIKAEQGDINVDADTIYNWAYNSKHGKNRFIAGRDLTINRGRIVNEQAIMSAGRDFNFMGSNISNKISSSITANRRVNIDTDYISNLSSSIQAVTGRMDITVQDTIVNDTKGVISSDKLMNITSPKLTNSGIIVSNNGKSTFRVNDLTNKTGYIKGFNLNFISMYLNNSSGLIKADNNLVMNADYISNTSSSDFSKNTYNLGLTSQKGGIIADNGSINLKGYQLNNGSGIIQTNAIFPAAGEADINITMGNEIINNYAQINSAGSLKAEANTISNNTGVMNAGLDLTAKAERSINNYYGKINAGNTTKVTTPSLSNQYGQITGNPVIIETN